MVHLRKNLAFTVIAGSLLMFPLAPLALAAGATVDTGTTASAENDAAAARLADSFSASAGSRVNALAVVEGLRSGKGATVEGVAVSGTGKTTGYGNINIAMSLAQSQVAPAATSKDFLAALDAVMDMRASGMGWGQIAHSLGVNLGQVMSASKSGQGNAKGASASKASGSATVADGGKAVGLASGGGNGNGNGGSNAGGNGNGTGGGNGGGNGGGKK